MHGTIKLNNFVDIRELSQAEVLTALFNAAIKPQNAISMNYSEESLSLEKAQQYLAHSQKLYLSMQAALNQIKNPEIRDLYSNRRPSEITHMLGRVLNIDLSQPNLDVRDYDFNNGGRGTARRAIESLSYVKRRRSSTFDAGYMPISADVMSGLPIPVYNDQVLSGLEVIAEAPHRPLDNNGFELH